MQKQCTIAKKVEVRGIEPFGGKPVKVTINKAPPNTGKIFRTPQGQVPATLDYAEPAPFKLIKTLQLVNKKNNARVIIPEHIVTTLFAYGIDNAYINLQKTPSKSLRFLEKIGLATNAEIVPYFPELEKTLCDAIEKAGIEEQDAPRKILRLEEKIETEKLTIEPIDKGIKIKAFIRYPPSTGRIIDQFDEITLTPKTYKEISQARAYCPAPPGLQNFLLGL